MKGYKLRLLPLLLILVLTVTGCAPASSGITTPEDEFSLWLSPAQSALASNNRPINAVKWFFNIDDYNYYLYCPAEANPKEMAFWFYGAEECVLEGVALKNGKSVNISSLLTRQEPLELQVGQDYYDLVIMKSANLGAMYIETQSGTMDYIHLHQGNKELGRMHYVDAKGKQIYSGDLTHIRGRGNATWKMDKKAYQIKLPKDCDLVGQGAGAAKTWLLLANFTDKTSLHNLLAYDLAADVGIPYTCRSIFVDLYCNGEYMGLYQLCEKVQVANNRIEIVDLEKETQAVNPEKLKNYLKFGQGETYPGSQKGYLIPNNPADITGGYLLELEIEDRYANETCGFVTDRGKYVVVKEPAHASKEQVAYIANYFQEFEDAVFATDGINPTTGKRFDQYFDLTSLANKYILEELAKNFDADKTSQFYFKPSDQESDVGYCGPAWDYDNSFDIFRPAAKNNGMYAANNQKYIYYHLNQHEVFTQMVKKQWNQAYLPLIEMATGQREPMEGTQLKPLTYYYELLGPSAAMSFNRWNNIETPVYTSTYIVTGSTFEEHYDYFRNYLIDRAEYLDGEWGDD